MKERRKYVRINIPLEVSYGLQGKQGVYYKSVTKNISANGARFCIEEELPKGTVLDIAIKIPTKPQPIPIKARIVWTKKQSEQGKDVYDSGFEIVEIDESCKSEFFQYLCTLMYDQLKKIG